MFGTWQPTSRESPLTERSPAASVSRTHSRLGSASARPTAANRSRSISLEIVADVMLGLCHHLRKYASRPGRHAYRAPGRDGCDNAAVILFSAGRLAPAT